MPRAITQFHNFARTHAGGVPYHGLNPSCANSIKHGGILMRTILLMTVCALLVCLTSQALSAEPIEYKLLATNKTSAMEKEMNQAAADGFHFEGTMGGETAAGGNEIVVIMSRRPTAGAERFQYRLLATNK